MNNGRKNTTLKRFFDLCKQKRFKKAMVSLLPFQIGNALAELMYGEDVQELFEQFYKKAEEQQDEIIKKLEDFMVLRTNPRKPAIAIGSGYCEIIVKSRNEVILGNKHTVELQDLIGGSGANFALRLMAAGYASMPILPIGNDKAGKYIREEVLKALTKAKSPESISAYVNSDSFLNCSIKTPTSIILAGSTRRTVFVQKLDGAEHFRGQLESQLDVIDALFDESPGPIMIGHIQSDSVDGALTKDIVKRYHNRSLIYTVFGNSQIKHGWEFWDEKNTFNEIDIFQLNFEEAQCFLASNSKRKSLKEILDWFRARKLTCVLTMSKFGAIGTFKDMDCIFIAYPLIRADEVVDTTGSGDAFAAGMVSYLCEKRHFDMGDFMRAMQRGRVWASCACKSLGGIGKEPDEELAKFLREHPGCEEKPVEMKETGHAEEIMGFIDLAHR